MEPVDDSCSSVHQSEAGEGGVTRTRRSGQHTLAVLQAVAAGGSKAVSRPPLLSAIEEGNTVTSLRQLLPRSDSQDTASVVSTDDLFSDFNTTTESVYTHSLAHTHTHTHARTHTRAIIMTNKQFKRRLC